VAVEVDGDIHFQRPWRGSRQQQRQQQHEAKDRTAWEAAQPVLRVHHQDAELRPVALQAARRLEELPQLYTIQLYTSSHVAHHFTSRIRYKGGSEAPLDWNQVGAWMGGEGAGRQALIGQHLQLKPVLQDVQ